MFQKVKYIVYSLMVAPFVLASCTTSENNQTNHKVHVARVGDIHSYANLDKIRTKHLHLELDVNFPNKTIYGIARHQMERLKKTDTAIFDIKYLNIQKVTTGKGNEKDADYVIGETDSILGAPLLVAIDSTVEYINIYYKTTEKTEALDWLDPELTEGKKHPFLYS